MEPFLYLPVYLTAITILCFSYGFQYMSSPDFRLQAQRYNRTFPLIISLILVLWLGGRPINGIEFGDSINYALEYAHLPKDAFDSISLSSEGLWTLLMLICKNLGLDAHGFFIVVETGYILCAFRAIKKFVPTNPMLGMLFLFSSLMFYNFATNGIRNGLACHILLLAIAFFLEEKYLIAIILGIISFGFHKSVMLPIAALIAGSYMIKDFKYAIYIWIGSIFVSLIAGGPITNFISGLELEERLTTYSTDEYQQQFSATGFRIDFLIYSMPPIILGWYALVKKGIKDEWYRILSVAYCLANAFWVIIIRIAFTNRFAYLSWFMYPVLLAYPLLNLPIWQDQDKKIGLILIAYCSFTLFMQLIVW